MIKKLKHIAIFHRIIKWSFIIFLILLALNLIAWLALVKIEEIKVSPKAEIYNKGLVVKFGPAVFVFGHGGWETTDILVVRHYTTLNNKDLPTDSLIRAFHDKGVRYIWLSACAAGDYEFMSFDRITRQKIPWPDYVSRGYSGDVIPFFFFWFGRISIGKKVAIDTSMVNTNSVTVTLYPTILSHEKNDVRMLTKRDKMFIFQKVKEIRKENGCDNITYANEEYKVPIVCVSSIVMRDTIFTPSSLMIEIDKKSYILNATGWIRNNSFPVFVKIQPIVSK